MLSEITQGCFLIDLIDKKVRNRKGLLSPSWVPNPHINGTSTEPSSTELRGCFCLHHHHFHSSGSPNGIKHLQKGSSRTTAEGRGHVAIKRAEVMCDDATSLPELNEKLPKKLPKSILCKNLFSLSQIQPKCLWKTCRDVFFNFLND